MARKSAAASKAAEKKKAINAQLKVFRASSDVNSFYRYVHENDMRHEAKVLLETVLDSIGSKRGRKSKKTLQ